MSSVRKITTAGTYQGKKIPRQKLIYYKMKTSPIIGITLKIASVKTEVKTKNKKLKKMFRPRMILVRGETYIRVSRAFF